jgi:hypothetical protein
VRNYLNKNHISIKIISGNQFAAATMPSALPKYQHSLRLSTHTARISAPRRSVFCLASKLVLLPIGDGDVTHIKGGISVEPAPAVQLEAGIYELGRVEPADIIVNLPTVSGRHCMIRVEEDDKVFVTDLGSTNGTSIDSMKLEPMKSVR